MAPTKKGAAFQKAVEKELKKRMKEHTESHLLQCQRYEEEIARLKSLGMKTPSQEQKHRIVQKVFAFLLRCHDINRARQGAQAVAAAIGVAIPTIRSLLSLA
jgi:hypothetical protein